MPQLNIFCLQVKLPVAGRNGLHLVKSLSKGNPQNPPQTSQAIVKAVACSPQTDGKSY